jgi:hypothetical protein
VIAALFNAPKIINPKDMKEIQLHHNEAKNKYLNLRYGGKIPYFIKRVHKIK